MDAATWLRQMGGETAQAEKRTQLTELCGYLTALDSFDNLLFEGMERVAAFFGAERASVFIPDLDNHLRAVAWVSDSVRELRLPSDPGNLIGWAVAARSPASIRNVWDLAELVRLHPRLRPDDRLDQWLGLRLRSAILAPLAEHDKGVGVMLIANRTDESGVFPARDVGYAGEVAKTVAGCLAVHLGLRTSVQPVAAPAPAKTAAVPAAAPKSEPTPASPAQRPSAGLSSVPTLPTPTAVRQSTPSSPGTARSGTPRPTTGRDVARDIAKDRPEPRPANKWEYLVQAGIIQP